MKKFLLILVVLCVSLSAFAEKPFSIGLSASPFSFEFLYAKKNYHSSYGSAARVDFEHPLNDNFHVGLAFMGSFGYFKGLDCYFVTSYYTIGKIGYNHEVSEKGEVGIDAQIAYQWSHVHPTSKSSLTAGANVYYKHTINDQVNLKASCDILATPKKTIIEFEGKATSLAVIPMIGAEVWFNKPAEK